MRPTRWPVWASRQLQPRSSNSSSWPTSAAQPIDLEGVRLAGGVEFAFPAGSRLGPGEYTVVVKNLAAFQSRYGTATSVAGQFARGQLSVGGGQLELRDRQGALIQSVTYDDQGDWPDRADGRGSSLELMEPRGGSGDAAYWRASSEFGGSPAAAGAGPNERVRITEVLAHSGAPRGDMLELHNTTAAPVDVGNWYVSTSSDDYFQAQVHVPTIVPAGGYAVLDGQQLGFDFDWWRPGEAWLVQADAGGRPVRFVDHVQFGPSGEGVSWGPVPASGSRWLPLAERTFGAANSGLRPGEVIISEVHYAPRDPDGDRRQFKADQFEFVELVNWTSEPVDLTQWHLSGGAEMVFPRGTVIAPGAALLVVPFESSDTTKASVFRVTYGLDSQVQLVGPYAGRLADDGQLVRLERPDLPPAREPTWLPYLLVDEVHYLAAPPWPADIVGTGQSLQRIASYGLGDLAANWVAQPATPAVVDFAVRIPGDADEDGHVDRMDMVRVLQSGKFVSGEPAVWADGDWNGDGVFDYADLHELKWS